MWLIYFRSLLFHDQGALYENTVFPKSDETIGIFKSNNWEECSLLTELGQRRVQVIRKFTLYRFTDEQEIHRCFCLWLVNDVQLNKNNAMMIWTLAFVIKGKDPWTTESKLDKMRDLFLGIERKSKSYLKNVLQGSEKPRNFNKLMKTAIWHALFNWHVDAVDVMHMDDWYLVNKLTINICMLNILIWMHCYAISPCHNYLLWPHTDPNITVPRITYLGNNSNNVSSSEPHVPTTF